MADGNLRDEGMAQWFHLCVAECFIELEMWLDLRHRIFPKD